LCSACYQEIARRKVVAVGGVGFSDEFANSLVDPSTGGQLFYSAGESASRIETAFAQFYCNQLSSVNTPTRKVKWAETQNPAQNFNGQPRRLGVISTNDPDNENTVKNVLEPALARFCGDKIWHTYFYAQDINTAAQQVAAGIAAMDTPTDPANIVLCLCDPVAPAFLFEGEQDNNYYPENVIATDQSMDLDNTAQSYGPGDGGDWRWRDRRGAPVVRAQQLELDPGHPGRLLEHGKDVVVQPQARHLRADRGQPFQPRPVPEPPRRAADPGEPVVDADDDHA